MTPRVRYAWFFMEREGSTVYRYQGVNYEDVASFQRTPRTLRGDRLPDMATPHQVKISSLGQCILARQTAGGRVEQLAPVVFCGETRDDYRLPVAFFASGTFAPKKVPRRFHREVTAYHRAHPRQPSGGA